MRRIKETLHLFLDKGLSQSQVALALNLARSTVQDYLHRFQGLGIDSKELAEMSEDVLEKRLFCQKGGGLKRPEPDCSYLHLELMRAGVTLQLLWEEHKREHPAGLGYTQFCERYRNYAKSLGVSMRQTHTGGEKAFVDYSGKRLSLVEANTGRIIPVEMFVMVFGASNYLFAEGQESQSLRHWIGGHIRAFQAFDCVPHHIVPDCLKSAVTKAHLYDPDLNETYVEMCRHYGTALLPARPYRPRDKAKAEVGVQIVQRWVLARLRNRVFHDMATLNIAITELIAQVNTRKMRHLGKTRLELFVLVDKPNALALPCEPFQYYAWQTARVGVDYCVQVEKHYYSVPYIHAGEKVGIRLFETSVEFFLRSERIAVHVRSKKPYAHTLLDAHMPEKHRKHLAWTPARLLSWAEKTGPSTAGVVKAILASKPHVEMGFRPALGVLRLADTYGAQEMEAVCRYALPRRLLRVAQLCQLLKMGRGNKELFEEEETTGSVAHDNLRGMEHYAWAGMGGGQ